MTCCANNASKYETNIHDTILPADICEYSNTTNGHCNANSRTQEPNMHNTRNWAQVKRMNKEIGLSILDVSRAVQATSIDS